MILLWTTLFFFKAKLPITVSTEIKNFFDGSAERQKIISLISIYFPSRIIYSGGVDLKLYWL